MPKKKTCIPLNHLDLSYQENDRHIQVISFNPNTMEVETSIEVKGEKKKVMKLPFAHLPKEIKKLIKPV
jgi:hypothetical protein